MAKPSKEQIEENKKVNRLIQGNKYNGCIWGLNPSIDEDCSPKIIAAHSIQRGKILANIADNGNIYCFSKENTPNTFAVSFQPEGISKFSTIKAFCETHDKKVFQEIEDKPFEATPLQMDLYAYRAVSKVLYSNLSSKNTYDELIKEGKFSPDNDPSYRYQNTLLNIKELQTICFHIQDVITNHNLRGYEHIGYTLDKAYPIACSSSFILHYDFNGKKLFTEQQIVELTCNQDDPTHIRSTVILNVFPEKGKTHIILSISNYHLKFKREVKKLFKTNEQKIKYQLSGLIINYIENIAFNPSYIDNLFTKEEKDKICQLFISSNINSNKPIKNNICLFRE